MPLAALIQPWRREGLVHRCHFSGKYVASVDETMGGWRLSLPQHDVYHCIDIGNVDCLVTIGDECPTIVVVGIIFT